MPAGKRTCYITGYCVPVGRAIGRGCVCAFECHARKIQRQTALGGHFFICARHSGTCFETLGRERRERGAGAENTGAPCMFKQRCAPWRIQTRNGERITMTQATLYPLKFDPIYQYRIWGGRRLEHWMSKPLPPNDLIGEAWILSD